jgi:hypothetical protein
MRSYLPVMKAAAMVMTILCLVFAPAANACPAQPGAASLNALRMSLRPPLAQSAATQAAANSNGGVHNPAIVGMWEVTLFAGGAVYDHALSFMPMAWKCRTAALCLLSLTTSAGGYGSRLTRRLSSLSTLDGPSMLMATTQERSC